MDFYPGRSVGAMPSTVGDSSRVVRLDLDLAEVLVGMLSCLCLAGPLLWLFVRYWVFAP